MNIAFLHSLQGEWLKKRRSHAAWLVAVGAFFTSTVVVVARLVRHRALEPLYAREDFWTQLWHSSWESMAIFFLPMGAVLAVSLITQLEYRNNAWKQVRTLPLGDATLFFSKLTVILLMMAQFLLLFSLGIWLSVLIPWILVPGVPYPTAPLPYMDFLRDDLGYFLDCLPIVALQYLISLRFKSFLVPIGTGFVLWVGSLAALSWHYGALIPYSYCMLDYLKDDASGKSAVPLVDIHAAAGAYCLLFIALGYWVFTTRKEKG